MIVTAEILGGLGNQLYLISACYVLAKRLGYQVFFKKNSEAWSICGSRPTYWDTLFKDNILTREEPEGAVLYQEQDEIMEHPPNAKFIKLFGHFQNYRLHINIYEEIKDKLFHPDCVSKTQEIMQIYRNKYIGKKLVSLHYRAGDFLLLRDKHGKSCDVEYYRKALHHYPIDDCVFLLFSESQELVEKYAIEAGVKDFEYVQNEDYIEMLLMSECDGNIVNNSTFSWWGAFRNREKKSLAITMPRWWWADGSGAIGTEYRYFFPGVTVIDNS